MTEWCTISPAGHWLHFVPLAAAASGAALAAHPATHPALAAHPAAQPAPAAAAAQPASSLAAAAVRGREGGSPEVCRTAQHGCSAFLDSSAACKPYRDSRPEPCWLRS